MNPGDKVRVQDAPLFLGMAALEWGGRGGQTGTVAEVDGDLVLVEFKRGPAGWFLRSLLDEA